MYSFILLISKTERPANAGQLLVPLSHKVVDEGDGWFRIEGTSGISDGWMAILEKDSIFDSYEDEARELIQSKVKNPVFYLVQSRDKTVNFSNALVQSLRHFSTAYVDNDNGYVGSISEVNELILSGVDWRYYSAKIA
jgi:hypothetical protein